MLYTELYRFNIQQDKLTVPYNIPNNLRKIKALFDITDKELATRLGIEPSYISSITNCKATFSGKLTIKLLQELDINFSLFSDIDDTITTDCYEYQDALIVISSDIDLSKCSIEQINEISYEFVKIYDDNNKDTIIKVVSFSELENDGLLYSLNEKNNFYDEPGEEKFNLYNNFLKEVPIIDNNGNFIYAIGAEIRKVKEKLITIDTLHALDKDRCSILSKIPFKKINLVSIPEDNYTFEFKGKSQNKVVKLENTYKILTNKGIKSVNTLKASDYRKVANNSVVFNAFTNEYIWNKLKAYRLLAGYSSEYMAKLLDIRKESYRLLEIGHNRITTHQMWIIENKLGVLIELMVDFDLYNKKFNS